MPAVDIKALREAVFTGEVDLPEMQPVLALYRDLFDAATEPLHPAEKLRLPSAEEARVRMEEGFCLLGLPGLMPSESDLASRAARVQDVLAGHTDRPSAEIAVFKEGGVLVPLVKAYLEGGEERLREAAARKGGLNPEVALFIVFNSLKGVFLPAARSLAGIDTESWKGSGCPVCGGAAAAAFLAGEGGARSLICHRCHSRWRVARIYCPTCENTDHVSLGYFTIEGRETGPRVNHCQKCSGYIKTWDMREREHLVPEAEDLKTPAVDLVARREGFFRTGPNIFGVVSAAGPVSEG